MAISLAAARKNAGLNQSQVAKKLGITRETLGNWELGKTKIPYYRLLALSKLYKLEVTQLSLPG